MEVCPRLFYTLEKKNGFLMSLWIKLLPVHYSVWLIQEHYQDILPWIRALLKVLLLCHPLQYRFGNTVCIIFYQFCTKTSIKHLCTVSTWLVNAPVFPGEIVLQLLREPIAKAPTAPAEPFRNFLRDNLSVIFLIPVLNIYIKSKNSMLLL